ncbi:MAG: hypothetical protein A2X08_13320 [Bacteroidetes bacterium GWA2_32_17]|nr:MAG: hypothetical protein A2X08_13320 [Bacteroidetes bacterium GWA2_32_17]
MYNNITYIFLIWSLFISFFLNNKVNSQNIQLADSIKNQLTIAKEDSTIITLFIKLGDVFEVDNPDSAEHCYKFALKAAIKNSNSKFITICYNKVGLFYSNNGNYKDAIKAYQTLLNVMIIQKNEPEVAYCYLNIGEVYMYQGNYLKALDLYQKALKIFEKYSKSNNLTVSLSCKKGMVRSYNDIGTIHAENQALPLSLEYFKKALATEELIGDKRVISGCYNNIGIIYYMQSDYPQAIEYYKKSLKTAEEINDKPGMSERYNNLGLVYADKGNNNLAINYYLKSFKIDEKLGDKKGMAIVLGNISLLNNQIKNYKEAIKYAERSLEIAKNIGSLDEQKCAYNYLSSAYDSLENYKKTSQYLKLFKLLNDSIYNIESGKQIKEMEAIYQTEKKQKEIELLNKDKELQNAKISKQETQKIGLIAGIILMLVLSVVIFVSYNQKKKANKLLVFQKHQIEEKNEELNQQNEEISSQRDEIESQRDLLIEQKNKIEEIHSELTSSIHYAKRIQNALLPKPEIIDSILSDYFILYKPRDIVSGDFYWATQTRGHAPLLIVAVADCTGHGVPGAFMSMLGISFLNEIVRKQEITQANHVLNELRKEIVNALQQKGQVDEQKDGMDISLLVVNTETNECQWAGANNPLYIIRSNSDLTTFEKLSNLEELKGDKMPIAIYLVMNEFTNHNFKVAKGDCLYLFSDGFSDQYGGSNKRKYLSGNFKKLLQNVSNKSMEEQKTILNETIDSWMNCGRKTYEQTDDITVLGIKI